MDGTGGWAGLSWGRDEDVCRGVGMVVGRDGVGRRVHGS